MAVAERAFRGAGVRMAVKKAEWLAENVGIVSELGGPRAFARVMEQGEDRDQIVKHLRQLQGIGPKYARNLPMDGDHPKFRDSIAIDVRIRSISRALGVEDFSYTEQEQFYLGVARDAGMDGLLLDRVLYNFTPHVLRAIGVTPEPRPRRRRSSAC